MDTWWVTAGLVGGGVALALIAEHYLGWPWRDRLRAYPPLAYMVGVGTLFGGYGLWALLTPGLLPALTSVVACALITGCGGAGTVFAYWWHGPQQAAIAAHLDRTLGAEAEDE